MSWMACAGHSATQLPQPWQTAGSINAAPRIFPTPVRLAAIQTILHIGDLSHHDKLRPLLLDPDRSIREAAFLALEAIGERTGQAIPR